MGYVAKVRFGGEPGDEVMQRAEYYLDLPNGWIREQGVGGRGVKERPSMPIVAVVALAIAVIETNKCHKGTKQGKHKVNNHKVQTQRIPQLASQTHN
jgi:hypothetical protein